MKFIIYSPIYDENSGGPIVLHKLCQKLNELGYQTKIWHAGRPLISELKTITGLKKWLKFTIRGIVNHKEIVSPYRVSKAKNIDILDSVVIYPEVVEGNPLRAEMVIRWYLNKPGTLTQKINFGKNELHFYFDKQFDDPDINSNPDNYLNVVDIRRSTYKQHNFDQREGSCYMVRKGLGRALDQHDSDSVCVDGLSHDEASEVFNRCKYFICYDLYTMYSVYAALCGCIPIVVPEDGLTLDEWYENEENRLGLAYGWENEGWAINTRHLLIEYLDDRENKSTDSVKNFAKMVIDHFGLASTV